MDRAAGPGGQEPAVGARRARRPLVPVLAGGGSRLSAHVGVLRAIDELRIPYSTLVGVSGGSIVGALAASGFDHDDMLDLARTTDFTQFSSLNLFTLFRTGGLSNGDRFDFT